MMLSSPPCMGHNLFRWSVLGGVAFLFSLPTPGTFARTLHQEAIAYRAQGYEAQQRGDQSTAFTFYQKATILDPAYAAPQNDLGILLEEAGRLEEAERAYQRALALDPTYLDAHANLAMLDERLGRKEQAIQHWLKRFELGNPEDPWTVRAKERLIEAGLGPILSGDQQINSLEHILKILPSLDEMEEAASRMRADAHAQYQHVVSRELSSHAQSLREFHAVTSEHENWHR